jgi:hypothetical protein
LIFFFQFLQAGGRWEEFLRECPLHYAVKPLYGHQQGAVVGYNPQKPGRPSHVYHSYLVANLRIRLGVEVRSGNEHAAAKGLPGLWQTLEKLPRHQWPTFTRGDSGYGNENTMLEHEERGLPYLFKLRHTAKVKELVTRMMRQGALWQDCGDGWEAMETTLRLTGWTRERRVTFMRENPARAPVAQPGKRRRGKDRQTFLPAAQGDGWDASAAPWDGKIAVLVTSLDPEAYPTCVMPKHYRDRGDAENCFGELKNQWGWNGYTSRRLASSRLMANLIALIDNWWNLLPSFLQRGSPSRSHPHPAHAHVRGRGRGRAAGPKRWSKDRQGQRSSRKG